MMKLRTLLPNCNAAVAATDGADGVAGDPSGGLFWSILFMIGSVLTLGFAVVFFIVRIVRRADAVTAADTQDPARARPAGQPSA
jgi:hypothetical protein